MDCKDLAKKIANECHSLREQHEILSMYFKLRKTDEVFNIIAINTNDFWVPILRAVDDSICIHVTTLLGPSKVNGVEQISFQLFFDKQTAPAIEEKVVALKLKYCNLIKKLKDQRNKYSAHKFAGKVPNYTKDINEISDFLGELKTLSQEIESLLEGGSLSFHDGNYARTDFEAIAKRLKDASDYYKLQHEI